MEYVKLDTKKTYSWIFFYSKNVERKYGKLYYGKLAPETQSSVLLRYV